MLDQLKKIEYPVQESSKSNLGYHLDEKAGKLSDFFLKNHIPKSAGDGERFDLIFELNKQDKKYIVRTVGIIEDWKITLDDKLVLECVYDNYYNHNEELIDIILN
jgi:hypothetical protein